MAHSVRRTLAALLLLGVAVAILASLGAWQLRRADERRALLSAIEAGRSRPPLSLSPRTPAAGLLPWRPAQATGRCLDQYSVLRQIRHQQGRPGHCLTMPLLYDPPRHRALLVLRGRLLHPPGE